MDVEGGSPLSTCETSLGSAKERHACHLCGNQYNRRWNLLRHVKEQHDTSAELHKCPIDGCDFNSKRHSTVKRHVLDKHGDTSLFPKPVPRNKNNMMNLYRQQVLRARSFCISADLLNRPPHKFAKLEPHSPNANTPSVNGDSNTNSIDLAPNSSPPNDINIRPDVDASVESVDRRRILVATEELSVALGCRIAILAMDNNGVAFECDSEANMPQFMNAFNSAHKVNVTDDNIDNNDHRSSSSSEDILWNESDDPQNNVAWIAGPAGKWLAVPVVAVSNERPKTSGGSESWESQCSESSVISTSAGLELYKQQLTREFEPLFQA